MVSIHLGLLVAERRALATPPAGVAVETGFGLWLRGIIETMGLVGVGLARLVSRFFLPVG